MAKMFHAINACYEFFVSMEKHQTSTINLMVKIMTNAISSKYLRVRRN